MYFKSLKIMTLWSVALVVACALLAPLISALDQQQLSTSSGANSTAQSKAASEKKITTTAAMASSNSTMPIKHVLTRRDLKEAASDSIPTKIMMPASMGDIVGLGTALNSRMDLAPAAGEHKKKYILVKKKPKMKKIKMEVYEPKMKYKKIKMKVPVKKMKKKKVKGYLVKKEHEHH